MIALLLALSLFLASQTASAQDLPRVSVAALFGTSMADAATSECCELRTPPSLVTLDDPDRPRARIYRVDGRFSWTARTSTFVQFERSSERTWHFMYPRPAVVQPPFNAYGAERHLWSRHNRWTAGQTVELLAAGRVRPWVFGAFDIRGISERQRAISVGFTDPTIRFESNSDWRRRQLSISVGGAARVHLSPRAFLGGEVSHGWGVTERCTDCDPRVRIDRLERARAVSIRGMAGVTF